MAKRLVVCCDGTWNRPDQLRNGVAAPTNVAKVALAVAREDAAGTPQVLHYQPGVGTRRSERLRGGAFGAGLSRNVLECYRFLVECYEPGDELYLFGFSRGAFTARSLAGLVRNSGIVRAQHAARVEDAYRLYRSRAKRTRPNAMEARLFRRMHSHPACGIHFVGVWDTVGSLGIPIDGVRLPVLTRRWSFHDTTLSSHVRHAYHALAIDERRGPFRPTLWEQQAGAEDQVLEQVWFAGVHSDVGGGYEDPSLSEIPLLWMVDRARACGLAFEPGAFDMWPEGLTLEGRHSGAQVAPDALGRMHESLKGFYRLLARYERPLVAEGGAVASSAVRRHAQTAYGPPGLAAYEGPTVTVTDGRPAPAESPATAPVIG